MSLPPVTQCIWLGHEPLELQRISQALLSVHSVVYPGNGTQSEFAVQKNFVHMFAVPTKQLRPDDVHSSFAWHSR